MPNLPIAAMIAASVIATSSTGGNVVGQGGVVHTGSSYSSSQVVTVSNSGGSSVDIETNINGEVYHEHRDIPGTGSGVDVSVSASATSGPADVEVHVTAPATSSPVSWLHKIFSWGKKSSTTTSAATSTASSSLNLHIQEGRTSVSVLSQIGLWVKGLWSFLR